MTSSMLAGDRRWAPARRGSMVTLGKVPKVVVPKPINLPSQRLENHGLDPNVEIVPKGSHSWGNRPSSSTSNPWGSSGLSPNADGTTGSPSHASGCPSSGGSCTRPSTSSSDRIQDPSPSAWGPNSRPSSASGALTSNQTSSMPLRPHSAETRPGSSQLSRFAEPSPDNSVAWGPTGPVDKVMESSTKKDGFSLSSGDFPTLGAEKENTGKSTGSQDYGSRGGHDSSSARGAPLNDAKEGTTIEWRRDGTQHIEDGVHPSLEKWPGGYPQPYLNPNVPPHCYDAWNGPPINAPTGVWYRGPSGGPPYGPPVGPGGFPVEPFPYYRPQMPPPALGNSHIVAGPRGHHPKNGDVYRPQIPDVYMHTGMPIRPGFYPHPVAYDNYYGPPMGYCNPNERDIPFRGMASGPVFNRYPSQTTHEPGTGHARAGGCSSSVSALVSEQMETGRADNSSGPYKVLSKPHNEWDAQEDEGRWEHTAPGNVSVLEKVEQPRKALHKNEWGADYVRDEEAHFRRTSIADNSYPKNIGNRDDPLYSPSVKSPELSDEVKAIDDNWRTKSGAELSSFSEQPHLLPAASKDSILLRKIEGLNAKARASDGRHDKIRPQHDIVQINKSMDIVGSAAVYSEHTNTSSSVGESGVSTEGLAIHQRNVETSISRITHHGVEGRVDNGGKGRFNNPNSDGWRKKPLVAESFNAIPAETVGSTSTIHNWDHHTSVEAAGECEDDFPIMDVSEPLASVLDSSDSHAQRSKMRELARQRAMQLQKEEEERIKEQKSKAFAKLEELNKRTQAVDGSTQKMEKTPISGATGVEQVELQDVAEPVIVATRIEGPSSVLTSGPIVVAQAQTSRSISGVGELTFPSKNLQPEASNSFEKETPRSMPSKLDVSNAGADVKTGSQVTDSSGPRKKSSFKQKQIIQGENHFPENFISFGTIGVANITRNVAIKDILSAETVQSEVISGNSNIMLETAALQKKKFTKNGKNKNKLEDPSPASPNTPSVYNQEKSYKGSGKANASRSELDAGSAQSVMTEGVQLSELQCSAPAEGSIVKINNQRKSQPSRKIIRNVQSNKVTDKSHGSDAAIWAPVRTQHKTDAAVEESAKNVLDTATVAGQNEKFCLKSKRAEMLRYVPKPVAKELAQQGSTQKSVSSFVQNTSDETARRADSRFQRTEGSQSAQSVVENTRQMADSYTSGDNNKHIKQAKAPGVWQQRGSTELSHERNPSRSVQHEPLHADKDHVVAEPILSDGWGDGWNMPEEPNTVVNVTFGMKDQGGPKGKGKQHPYKSHKSMGNKHELDLKNSNSGEIDKKHTQAAAIDPDQEDGSVNAREYRGIGERAASHWQPKSQGYSGITQSGSRSSGRQHVPVEAVHDIKQESPLVSGDLPSMQDTEVISKLCSDQSVSKSTNMGETTVSRHQEGRRERKIAPSKERSQQELAVASLGADVPLEGGDSAQHISSGFHMHRNQNNHPGRWHESREDWGSVGQDNRHQTGPENRERRLRNSHYEYQPVGPYNTRKSNYIEGPTGGSRNLGSSFRGRGQGHLNRGGGNSYVRRSDAVEVDAGYD